jgi:hypothetical protein
MFICPKLIALSHLPIRLIFWCIATKKYLSLGKKVEKGHTMRSFMICDHQTLAGRAWYLPETEMTADT